MPGSLFGQFFSAFGLLRGRQDSMHFLCSLSLPQRCLNLMDESYILNVLKDGLYTDLTSILGLLRGDTRSLGYSSVRPETSFPEIRTHALLTLEITQSLDPGP